MSKIPFPVDDDDDGPALAGNPAAGNPDGVKSADLDVPVVPIVEGEDEAPV